MVGFIPLAAGRNTVFFGVDNVMVRYSGDQYQWRGSNYFRRTHFQSRGKNWAPVPDLCMSKLSVGSP